MLKLKLKRINPSARKNMLDGNHPSFSRVRQSPLLVVEVGYKVVYKYRRNYCIDYLCVHKDMNDRDTSLCVLL